MKSYQGAELLYVTRDGSPCGVVIRRKEQPDEQLRQAGVITLSKHLYDTGEQLANATLTAEKILPKSKGSIRKIDVSEVKVKNTAKAKTQEAPKPPSEQDLIVQYKHQLCEAAIRHIYGQDADANQYKVYRNDSLEYKDLRGVDIAAHDRTTPELYAEGKVAYSKIVTDAVTEMGFVKSAQHGGAWVQDVGGILFHAFANTTANGISSRSMLFFKKYIKPKE